MQVRFILLLLAFAFPLSSVGAYKAYPGPELPEDQIATIKVKFTRYYSLNPLVGIGAVDGNRLPSVGVRDIFKIAVKPGKHTLAVFWWNCDSVGWCKSGPFHAISFEAEAGHAYIVHGKRRRSDRVFWIKDKKTKQVVARMKPPKKEKKKKKKKE